VLNRVIDGGAMETIVLVLGVCGVGGGGAFYYMQQQAAAQAQQKKNQEAAKRARGKPLALAAPEGHVRKRPVEFGKRQ
jgi:uncharacterized protein HemX